MNGHVSMQRVLRKVKWISVSRSRAVPNRAATDLVKGAIGVFPLAPLVLLAEDISENAGLAPMINRLVDRLFKKASIRQEIW